MQIINTCCTWMFVRTHWWSVWECMTPQQYDTFIESMHHEPPLRVNIVLFIIGTLLISCVIWDTLIKDDNFPYDSFPPEF